VAAITPFIEQPITEAEAVADAKLNGLGDDATPEQVLVGQQSAGLHRFVWSRSVIGDWLAQREYAIEIDKGEYVFRLDQSLPRDLVPWSLTYKGGLKDRFPLWSVGNKKMATSSWDLPAGATSTGGSCPAATMGQPVVALQTRKSAGLTDDGRFLRRGAPGPDGTTIEIPFREKNAICLYCYAEGGRFAYTDVMIAPLLRYWWTQQMIKDGREEEWVQIMADSLDAQPPPVSGVPFAGDAPFRAVRVHSSGDYFIPQYAALWVELANEIARREDARGEAAPIVFWSPTRTWAMDNFDWPEILANLRRGRMHGGREILNLIVRPSAYHVNDPAPFPVAEGNAGGTTVTSRVPEKIGKEYRDTFTDADGREIKLFDLVCPAYATDVVTEAKRGPAIVAFGDDEGKREENNSCEGNNCRKCWTHPELRVNYPLH
jgi:hypothetical protein